LIRFLTEPKRGENISEATIMKNRSRVMDIVEKIQRDFVKYVQFVRVWRRSSAPIKVGSKFELMDKSIVGIYPI
jgi:ribosome-interacting GTPase 1